MIIIKGNSAKSSIKLDVDFTEFVLENTLTHKISTFDEVKTYYRGGLYHKCILDFSGLELGEYKYTAKIGDKIQQVGLLIIEPFDESENPVQVVTPALEKKVITYKK